MNPKYYNKKRLSQAMEILNDLEQICIQRSEDEGGADPIRDRGISERDSVEPERRLTEHIELAQQLVADGKYDLASSEMETVAERFSTYKQMLTHSLDKSIESMSTQGTSSCPPHPKTLDMIKLRKRL